MPKNRSDDEHATKNDSESDTRQGHAKWHKITAAQISSTGQKLACIICMLWQFRQFQSQAAQCRQTSGPNQFQKLGRRQFQLQSRLGQGLSKRLQRCRRCRLVVTSCCWRHILCCKRCGNSKSRHATEVTSWTLFFGTIHCGRQAFLWFQQRIRKSKQGQNDA